jgi:hypothetical protein
VIAAAGPFAGQLPTLVVEEPFAGPREDRFGDEPVGKPFVAAGVVEAERKALAVVIDINMRRRLPCSSGVETDGWGDDANSDVTRPYNPGFEIIAPRKISDVDGVGARDRRYLSLPRAYENSVEQETKAGPVALDGFILFNHQERAQISHQKSCAVPVAWPPQAS